MSPVVCLSRAFWLPRSAGCRSGAEIARGVCVSAASREVHLQSEGCLLHLEVPNKFLPPRLSGLVDEHLAAHFLVVVALALFYWLFTALFGWALPLAMLRVMIFAGGTRWVETGSSPSLSEELV